MSPGRPLLRRWATSTAALLLFGMIPFIASAPASAAPTGSVGRTATIDHIEKITDRWLRVFVDSPAMGSVVEVQLLLPRDTAKPRPTVYLLDGRSADNTGSHWTTLGNAVQFFDDKDVNAVLTVGGTASYYTDWQKTDPTLGHYKWETFLTKELPPLIDGRFDGNGSNAIVGLSMGAEAAMMLAVRAPQVYRAVASFSGCYTAADDFGQAQIRAVIASFGGDADNMFGAQDDPDWAAHDVVLHAAALRGKAIYVSAGSGLPGRHEIPANPDLLPSALIGGPLEAITNACTHQLAGALGSLGIPATFDFQQTGTHSWPYWTDDLVSSWPTIGGALGA
ncbi:alpha/beta hydrolase [Antrihabitans cavernicola]|uniref:Esterase family protein n=1 Tax=Antrihabitans cavernicola TaxID=2495913 RepID=A0A5A7SIN5_9NOCA|nr:alpha/beta hydrolase family protein [Spelaeibacter cavernicola]KAA0024587.1 esterase family protein [Spelaeibacter cavernicola]